MSILSRDEMLNRVRSLIGEDNSDESLSLIEDINDTFAEDNQQEIERLRAETTRLTEENKRIDNDWREKYKSRFFDGEIKPPKKEDEFDDKPKRLSYEDLFKEE